MSDFYTEQLIKKRTDGKDIMKKTVLIALTVISFFAAFLFPLLMLLPVIMIVVDVFLFRKLDVEYEYIYINGDLDIDKIMHKEKRKHMFSANVKDMEILAPENAFQLKDFRESKFYDYSSGNPESQNRYILVISRSGEITKVLFEPKEELIEGVYLLAPRKVIRK